MRIGLVGRTLAVLDAARQSAAEGRTIELT
jgi:hypothetical protein